jgi:hypothetical protein
MLTTEIVVAMGILMVALIPLSFSFVNEQKLCRVYYYRAAAMEIVDGEMEILAAGDWKNFEDGPHLYPVQGATAKNLPPGKFLLTKQNQKLRLEWLPEKKDRGGNVSREVEIK